MTNNALLGSKEGNSTQITKKEEKRRLQIEQSEEVLQLMQEFQDFNSDGKVCNLLVPDEFKKTKTVENSNCYFFKVKTLSYDEDYPHREALENVIMALDNEAFNFVYLLEGNEEGVFLYIGVVKNSNPNIKNKLSVTDYGELIQKMFEGNFSGSVLDPVVNTRENPEFTHVIIEGAKKFNMQCAEENESIAGVIVGIPSVNEKETGNSKDFQGIDRLINSMTGLNWRLIIVCEPLSKQEVAKKQKDVYELYNRLYVSSKLTRQKSISDGAAVSFGKNTSSSKNETKGTQNSKSDTKTQGEQTKHTNISTAVTNNYGTTDSIGESKQTGVNYNISTNKGTSDAVTIEMANKHAMELMKYIDEELLERIKSGIIKGMYNTSVFYMAEEPDYANRLKNGVISLFQGNKSTYSPLIAKELKPEDINNGILGCYQNLKEIIKTKDISKDIPLLYGRPYENGVIGLSSLLTLKEVSLLAGLPQQEVPGLKLKEDINFGLNVDTVEECINLGNVVQKGRELERVPFMLSRNSINKHIFIAGVTGSGKTTTCQKLLKEAGKDIPFLVIEPAKTEYRELINHEDFADLTIFTLGNETIAPFRLNPFEVVEGENISSHIDMIKATFTAAFPMEGSMPQMLEEAIYLSYKRKGWDIENNRHHKFKDPFNNYEPCFPRISDLLNNIKTVVHEKGFGERMENEYLGSLVSRLSNLTVGAKGRMLNCERSVDFNYIADHKIVDLKNPEDKSLFMGFILSRLTAVIRNKSKQNKNYKHITLVEEAHRLLSKVEYGDSGSKKASVETFTDLLAEVRKYGEGLIIVDQIPNKLASDVLKNTNTKIVHRIFAKDDKEVIGDTMMMDDKQKDFLSSLPNGHAIVFSENTDKPIHISIKASSHINNAGTSDEKIKERFEKNKSHFGRCLSGYTMFLNEACTKLQGIISDGLEFDKGCFDSLKELISKAAQKLNEDEIGNVIEGREAKICRDLVRRYYEYTGKGDVCGTKREKNENELSNLLQEMCKSSRFIEELEYNPKIRLDLASLVSVGR